MWRRYVRFFGPDVKADVDDEVADHLARLEAELRERGTPEAEIAAAVRARFGDADAIRARLRRSDELRHTRRMRLDALGSFGQDVAYALRRLRQRPGFTAAVVAVLALGVGATTAMFSAVDAAMLKPLPFPRADRLMVLNSISQPADYGPRNPPPKFNYPEITDVQAMTGTFVDASVYAAGSLNLPDAVRPTRVHVGVVTIGFFRTLGVFPARGREFTPAEGKPGQSSVVILSDALWRDHFGGRAILDSTISVSGVPRVVVGIMPPGFVFPEQSDLWIPMTIPTTFETFAPFHSFLPTHTLARLADGVSPAVADARVRMLWKRDAASAAVDSRVAPMFKGMLASLESSGYSQQLQPSLVGDRHTALLVLLGATALLLLIACANIMSLLLAQAAARRAEFAVRFTLGATRARVLRQLLTESVLLSAAGTGLGVLVAGAAFRYLASLLPAPLAGVARPELDLRVLAFSAGVALVTGVGFGLWPALGASRLELASEIRDGGRGATRDSARLGHRMLLAAELAISLILLVASGLALRSFAQLMEVNRGLDARSVATLELTLGQEFQTRAAIVGRTDAIIDRLRTMPGIVAVGAVNVLPLSGEGGISISVRPEGTPLAAPDQQKSAFYFIASPGYFQTLSIPLISGRTFTAADDSGAPPVAIINQAMADSLWPGESALGRRFVFPGNQLVTVVGVVGGVRNFGLDRAPRMQMYFPIDQSPTTYMAIVARSSLPPSALLARLHDAVRAVDPTQAVYRVRMMDDIVDESVAPQRTNTLLISLFGAAALLLSAVGVYAVVANGVVQRRRELGIRAALGASRRDLVRLVSQDVLVVALVALLIGTFAAWAASRIMATLVFGITTHDLATFASAPLVLIVPALVAAYVPARRAAQTDPAEVMRYE